MSQQTTQSDSISDKSTFQELKQSFNAGPQNKKSEFSRTLYSLLHPGSIDWFILREFLFLFVMTSLLISVLYVVMDFLNCADVFIQKSHQFNVSLPATLFQFYMPRLLALFDALLSVCVILSTILLIYQMIRRNEMLALSCMGIRRVRAAYMIFVVATILVILFALYREFVLPSQRDIITSDVASFFERDKARVEPKTDPMTSVYISGESLDLHNKTIIQPVFNMPIMILDAYGQTITADKAVWKEAQLGSDAKITRPAGYLLQNVVADKCLDDQSSLTLNDKPALITPLNNPWLKKGECFLISGIEVEDLTLNSELMEYSSISELQRIMERMPTNQRTDASIIMHKRIARPFIDLCIIFVGMSFVLSNDDKLWKILLKTALWWGVTWLIVNMCSALAGDADQLLSAAVAAWIPLICFTAAAAYVWDRVYY